MIRVIISGCNGHMGQVVAQICQNDAQVETVAGFNRTPLQKNDFPVYADPMEFTGTADVVIDFSNPANLSSLLRWCTEKRVPIVLCTTGYTPEQLIEIDTAAKKIPVFRSGNMSLGINLLVELVKKAAAVLGGDYDIEIVERHHNRKVDAPSGTALMLADAAAEAVDYDAAYVYDRQSVRKRREKNEIGISAVRGGNIVGEHEIIFAGSQEVLELKHSALSRDVFAEGAVKAAVFMSNIKAPGLYTMKHVLAEVLGR